MSEAPAVAPQVSSQPSNFQIPPSFTWPPINLWDSVVDQCSDDIFLWFACLSSNVASCDGPCNEVVAGSDIMFSNCEDTDSTCSTLACCDACVDEGRAYAACLLRIYQCEVKCGSFAPIAPATVDFPSISGSLLPVMNPLLSQFPFGGSPPLSSSGPPVPASPALITTEPPESSSETGPPANGPVGTLQSVFPSDSPNVNVDSPAVSSSSPSPSEESTQNSSAGSSTAAPPPTSSSSHVLVSTAMLAWIMVYMLTHGFRFR